MADKPKAPKFGTKFKNPSASDRNPQKYGFYVETIVRRGKLNPGKYYRLTDQNGNFWEIEPKYLEVVE